MELPIYGIPIPCTYYQHKINLALISQRLGYASLKTILVYSHANTEAIWKSTEKALSYGTSDTDLSSSYAIDDEEFLKSLNYSF